MGKNCDIFLMLGMPKILLAAAVCYLPYSLLLFYCSNDTVCHKSLKYFRETLASMGHDCNKPEIVANRISCTEVSTFFHHSSK
jgi:hypothetical protein